MAYADQLVAELLRLCPEFSSVYEEHIQEYDDLLPHVLMGEFTRWFIDQFNSAHVDPDGKYGKLASVLQFFERKLQTGNISEAELIGVSFLENLWQSEGAYDEIKAFMARSAPSLAAELAAIDGSEAE